MAKTRAQVHASIYEKGIDDTVNNIDGEIQRITDRIISGDIPFDQRMEFLRLNQDAIETFAIGQFTSLYGDSMAGTYADSIEQSLDDLGDIGIDAIVSADDIENFRLLRSTNTDLYSIDSLRDARQVYDSVFKWASASTEDTIAPFVFDYGSLKVVRHGSTIVDTQVSTFLRATNFNIAVNSGVKRFRYAGPSPDRPFCARIINKVFTLKEINKLNNGQTSNVFATGGGFNCRHRWVAIAPTTAEKDKQPSDVQVSERLQELGVG